MNATGNSALGLSIAHIIIGVLMGIFLAAALGSIPYGVGFAFVSLILPTFGLCGICFKNTCLMMTYAVIAILSLVGAPISMYVYGGYALALSDPDIRSKFIDALKISHPRHSYSQYEQAVDQVIMYYWIMVFFHLIMIPLYIAVIVVFLKARNLIKQQEFVQITNMAHEPMHANPL